MPVIGPVSLEEINTGLSKRGAGGPALQAQGKPRSGCSTDLSQGRSQKTGLLKDSKDKYISEKWQKSHQVNAISTTPAIVIIKTVDVSVSILKKNVLSQNFKIKVVPKDIKNIADAKKAVHFKIIKVLNSCTEIKIMTTVTPIINDKYMISKVNMLEDIIKANKKHIKERDG